MSWNKMENTDINLDIVDYKTIFSHKGKVIGLIGDCKIDDFIESFDETLKSSLPNAKGILINFVIHKEQSLFKINSCVGEIVDLLSMECEIIFGTEIDNSMDLENVKYEIIITGL